VKKVVEVLFYCLSFVELWKRLSTAYSAFSEVSASPIYASILHGYRGIKPQSKLSCRNFCRNPVLSPIVYH